MLLELIYQEYSQVIFYPKSTLEKISSQSQRLIQIEVLPHGKLRDLRVLGLRQICPRICQGL
jgi:hypothetical protein